MTAEPEHVSIRVSRGVTTVVLTALLLLVGAASPAIPVGASTAAYQWPVKGSVIRGFEAPASQFSSGHRGIDIAAPFGSPMVAAQEGTVAFAGWVGGSLFISIDHPDGVRSTYSWLSRVDVRKGAHVARGEPVGATGHGHAEVATPHLHFGARIGSTYIDPMTLLERGSVSGLIHLAPLEEGRGQAEGYLAAPVLLRRGAT